MQSKSDSAGSATDLARSIPVLPSTDLAETKHFYVNDLGMRDVVYEAPDYLIVRRDDIELHFWLTDDAALPRVSSCYIRGGQIVALHTEYASRGVRSLTELAVRPWNMCEFYLRDPHGNLLKFGAAPQEL